MNRSIYIYLTIALLLTSFATTAQNHFTANSKESIIHWKGSKVTGSHNGTIKLKEGSFHFSGDKLTGGEFIIDMNSIVVTDITNEKYNTKLVKHLKNDDFFGVEKYPTARFVIKKAEEKGHEILIKGDLTIKTKTNPVEFLATITVDDGKVFFKSETFEIDRSKWDIKYKSKSFFNGLGDNFIYDDMEISVEIKASKPN